MMILLLGGNDTVSISLCHGGGMHCNECRLVHFWREEAFSSHTAELSLTMKCLIVDYWSVCFGQRHQWRIRGNRYQ